MKNIIPVTNRIEKVRSLYLNTPMQNGSYGRSSYGNHPMTLQWMEGYIANSNATSTLLRRSLAQKWELEKCKIIIDDDELLVGKPDFYRTEEEDAAYADLFQQCKVITHDHPDERNDHMALDYRKLLSKGVEGLLQEIRENKAKLTFDKATIKEDVEKEEFYEACEIELNALIVYAKRYENELRSRAELAQEPRRSELIAMADNMSVVPRYPAKTFWQALQSIHFYTFVLRGLYAAGRPDQDLIDYYKADIEKGILTPAFAQELVDNYCLTFASYIHSNWATGLLLGGTNENGEPVENELTWMFLTAGEHIQMTDPNTGLCVSKYTSDEILQYALEIIGRGCPFPAFWNDEGIVEALIQNGYDERDAHRYVNSTCVELTIVGKTASWTTCPYHNLAQYLVDTLFSGEYDTFESLQNAFFENLKKNIQKANHTVNHLKLERSRIPTEPMLHSCLVSDCIARGKPVGNAGAIYNQTLPNFLGFANVVDGLSAIRTLVYEMGEVTFDTYKEALKNNFEGYEDLRMQIINRTEHYGNDIQRVDEIAKRLADAIQEGCKGLITLEGDSVVPAVFSYNYHMYYGGRTPATPDGRKSGMPLADSAGPAQGRDVNSPTATIKSSTVWEQCKFTGGVAQNMKVPSYFFNENGMSALISLIKTFFARGGQEIQLNTVNKKILEKAMKNPEEYANLIVRIGGYCDFFNRLSQNLKQEIIDRTEY